MAKQFPDTTTGGKWPAKKVLPTLKSGLDATIVTNLNAFITREATREALQEAGFLRGSNQTQNDFEQMNARKPKDIGDPDRIPGEK